MFWSPYEIFSLEKKYVYTTYELFIVHVFIMTVLNVSVEKHETLKKQEDKSCISVEALFSFEFESTYLNNGSLYYISFLVAKIIILRLFS